MKKFLRSLAILFLIVPCVALSACADVKLPNFLTKKTHANTATTAEAHDCPEQALNATIAGLNAQIAVLNAQISAGNGVDVEALLAQLAELQGQLSTLQEAQPRVLFGNWDYGTDAWPYEVPQALIYYSTGATNTAVYHALDMDIRPGYRLEMKANFGGVAEVVTFWNYVEAWDYTGYECQHRGLRVRLIGNTIEIFERGRDVGEVAYMIWIFAIREYGVA